jgi:hypothetical protein
MMARSTFRAIGATALVGLFLAACSSTPSLSAENVAKTIEETIANDVGVTVDEGPDVTCPSSLEGVIGNSIVCTVAWDGEEYDVDVTVVSVEGGKVLFDVTDAE